MSRIHFWITTAIGALAIFVAIFNAVVSTANLTLQADAAGRAQYVQQAAQLEGLYNDMVRALAELSMKNQDYQLRDLLQTVGITVKIDDTAPAAPKK